MRKLILYSLFSIFIGCSATKKRLNKNIENIIQTRFYQNQFTGLLVIDPVTKDTLYNLNSKKYFTPASNTKIFTLYTSIKALPEKIPALKYSYRNDTLYFEGTGDPSFLHPYLKDSTVYHFLKNKRNIVLYEKPLLDQPLGPGWAWEDYDQYYAPERSALPVYGNITRIFKNPELKVLPTYFKDSVLELNFKTNRALHKNLFYFDGTRNDTLEVPFKTNSKTLHRLLEASLLKKIDITHKMPEGPKNIFYGIPSDSLYMRLMHESDNFIAEQLLILSANQWTDTLSSTIARNKILEDYLADIPQQPRWVDGSGLSRYNLFTPQSMVYVLEKLYEEIPKERLFKIFPSAGISGTLTNWPSLTKEPYLYAKSGSLGNNYCLSGYLITNSGKTLIFSFMNNHFTNSSSEVKLRMQSIFQILRNTY
ncbi:D-alanyl-D-alanine carboxypeptidase [Maribacter sp. 2210JD10-5]|uniref:D-alanyl-D-alanine carboxypeptidase n=1 Tax=Maribacter sp. 2210JD10-5 TaxID=3386272 RepID=UPI0039BD595C